MVLRPENSYGEYDEKLFVLNILWTFMLDTLSLQRTK